MSKSGVHTINGAYTSTIMCPWREIRSARVEDGGLAADLTSGSFGFSDVNSNTTDLFELFGDSWSALVLAFYAGPGAGPENPAPDDTFGLDLLAWAQDAAGSPNPPQLITTISATAGIIGSAAVTNVTNALWADTLTLTFTDWFGDVAVYDTGANRTAYLVFDGVGIRYLWPRFHGVAGGTEAPQMACIGRVF